MMPHIINHLVSSTFTQEQKSVLKFERNNDLTFIVIIITDKTGVIVITFLAISPSPNSSIIFLTSKEWVN